MSKYDSPALDYVSESHFKPSEYYYDDFYMFNSVVEVLAKNNSLDCIMNECETYVFSWKNKFDDINYPIIL